MIRMNDQTSSDPNAAQETDVWWGGYSGLTLLPSLLVCFVLTGVIFWGAWSLVERRHVQWTIWTLTGAVWLVQSWRWGWRVFGINYRLTTRRLLIDRGHVWSNRRAIELASVRSVVTQRIATTGLTGVGRVLVQCDNGESVVMEGLSAPETVAALLRERIGSQRLMQSVTESAHADSQPDMDSIRRRDNVADGNATASAD